MRNFVSLLAALFITTTLLSQHTQTRILEPFHEVKLDGRAKIYLTEGSSPSVKLNVKREKYLRDYVTDVRNGVLYLKFEDDRDSDRKIKIYLTHTGITELDVDGLIYMETETPLRESNLRVKGDGFINGEIDVDVESLSIDMDGFTSMDVYGSADRADIKLDGFGTIDARELSSKSIQKDADGLARIRLSSRH